MPNNNYTLRLDTTSLTRVHADDKVRTVNVDVPTVLSEAESRRAVALELAATLVGTRSPAFSGPMLTLAKYINDGTQPAKPKRAKRNTED